MPIYRIKMSLDAENDLEATTRAVQIIEALGDTMLHRVEVEKRPSASQKDYFARCQRVRERRKLNHEIADHGDPQDKVNTV